MTRALLVSDVYFPRVNGVSTSIATFREALRPLGVDTTLVAPCYARTPTPDPAGAAADDAGVVRVPAAGVPLDPEDRRMRGGALRAALARLDGAAFDLVHVQTPFVAHYAGVRYARRRGIPVIATYHTLFEEYLHHYVPLLPRALGRPLARALTRAQCRDLDAIVVPSEPLRALLVEYGVRTPLRVIPTGLPPDRFEPGEGARFRAAHRIAAERPLLLYVGRVAHEKNLDFLLDAFRELHAARPDALLLIAGEGPARAHLVERAQALRLAPSVLFVGYLDRAQALRDCYAAADVFVFASRTETQGLVLLEAMAQGRPVVSTAQLGTASILQPGCGASVVPEDRVAFARAALDLIEDPRRAARAGAAAQRYAEGWSAAVMAQRLALFYREVRRGHASGAMDAVAASPAGDSSARS
ncbi:MAG: glycosyltransferase [Steroidobacteraceae bacterium]